MFKQTNGDDADHRQPAPTSRTPAEIEYAEEPIVNASIITPSDYVGSLMELCQERRGVYKDMKYLDTNRVDAPL